MILQSLWKLHKGWDEKIPEEIPEEWSVWQNEPETLTLFSVPRLYYVFMATPTSIQAHLFGDGSERAICPVI